VLSQPAVKNVAAFKARSQKGREWRLRTG